MAHSPDLNHTIAAVNRIQTPLQVQRLLHPLLSMALHILRPGGRIVFLYPGFVRPSGTNLHASISKLHLKPNWNSTTNTAASNAEINTTINPKLKTSTKIKPKINHGLSARPHAHALLMQPEWSWLIEWQERGLILDAKFTQTFANILRHCVCLIKMKK